MGSYRKFGKYIAAGIGACTSGVLLYYGIQSERRVYAATPVKTKWDINWDKRDPVFLVEEKGEFELGTAEFEKEVKKVVPTAVRHLFLIRHGQYNMDGIGDKERFLTELGRKQAECAGVEQ